MSRATLRRSSLLAALAAAIAMQADAQEPQAPQAQDSAVTCAESSVHVYTIPQYTDADGGTAYTYTVTSLPGHGALEVLLTSERGGTQTWAPLAVDTPVSSRTWAYTPTAGFTGADAFGFKVNDGGLDSNVAAVSITVTANTPPVASDQSLSLATGAVRVSVYLSLVDPDYRQPFTFTAQSLPAHGLLEWAENSGASGNEPSKDGEQVTWYAIAQGVPVSARAWAYTPAAGYTGADAFTWKASDSLAETGVATVSITVTGNTAPVLQDQQVTVPEGAVRRYLGLIVTDPDQGQPRFTTALSAPAHGTLEYYVWDQQSGTQQWHEIQVGVPVDTSSWYFTPAAGYTGADAFTWKVNDSLADSNTATLSITITANTLPTASSQSQTLVADSVRRSVYLSYSDPDQGQILTFTAQTTPAHGLLEYSTWDAQTGQQVWHGVTAGEPISVNAWTYTPAAGYTGADAFTWKVNDGLGDSNTATYSLTVTANTVPVAHDTRKGVLADRSTSWIADFEDPDTGQSRRVQVLSPPAHGAAVASGTSLTYTPAAGYTGTDQFTWKVNDGVADSNTATVDLLVRAVDSRAGMQVLLVVRSTLAPEIAAELARLEDDLEAEGYTTARLDWSGSGAEALWNDLRAAYLADDVFMAGAILIGQLPMPTNPISNEPTDLVYWNMAKYRDTTRQHIWVSRIWALDQWGHATAAGSEVELIRRALDANHAFRTGASHLPHTVYFRDTFNQPAWGGDPDKALEIWPEVQTPQRLAYSFQTGGDLLHETEHGDGSAYDRSNPRVHVDSIHAIGAQTRVALCTSCGSGVLGGVVNQQILTRGGSNVLSVGATRTTYAGAFVILRTWGEDSKVRDRLKAGDTWGNTLVDHYAFDDTQRAVFYGDMSFGVRVNPANKMPVVSALSADKISGSAPLTVTFTAAADDSDGTLSGYDWYPEGYNFGRVNPLASGAARATLEHTYALPHRYLARVQVRDNFQALAWKELVVNVGPTPGQPLRVNCGTVGTSANIFEEGRIYYRPGLDLEDSAGDLWLHDQAFAAGTWGLSGANRTDSVAQDVAGTEDDALYQSYRYADGSNTFTYKIPVSDGGYTLVLGFADMRSTAAGERLTDVAVEGAPFLTGFDAFATAGAKTAVERSTHVEVADGELSFTVSRNPVSLKEGFLSRFEVIPDGAINQPPTAVASAEPSAGEAPLQVQLSAAGSVDHDGSIVSYAWAFGDGESGSGVVAQHTYAEAGTYTAQVTVTDDGGLSAVAQVTINAAAPGNTPPEAVATATPDTGAAPLLVHFDGRGSSDADGAITAYAWTFGDGGQGSGAQPSHTYLAAGTYQVSLSVTDDAGGTGSTTLQVVVSAPINRPPVAAIEADVDSGWAPLLVSLSGAASSDDDGSVTGYAWRFGDGGQGSGVEVEHTYASAGTYTVTLTVTDDDGATASATLTIEVLASQNQAPTAHIVAEPTSGEAPLVVALDGRGSSDPDGSVVSYAWDFGDGTSASGAEAEHSYAEAGRYTVQLRVTDDAGASATATVTIEVLDPANLLPEAVILATPEEGIAPLLVSFDATGSSDADGSVVDFSWSFGDGGEASGAVVDHSFADPGTYIVILTVTDDDGARSSASVVIQVRAPANQPPVASAAVDPESGDAPLAVRCDGSASRDPDGSVASYSWDFGDGTSAQGAVADHTFAEPGHYTVELMVVDDQGATAFARVEVVVFGEGVDANLPDRTQPDAGQADAAGADVPPDDAVGTDHVAVDAGADAAAADAAGADHVGADLVATDRAGADRVAADTAAHDAPAADQPGGDATAPQRTEAPQVEVGSGCACSAGRTSGDAWLWLGLALGLSWLHPRRRFGHLNRVAPAALAAAVALASCLGAPAAEGGPQRIAGWLEQLDAAEVVAWTRDTRTPLARRAAALRALADRGTPAAVERLAAVGDAEVYLNWAAIEALGRVRDEAARPYLLATLRHDDARRANAAVRALAQHAGAGAVAPLAAFIRANRARPDGYGEMLRGSAVQELGRIGDAAAMPVLLEELGRVGASGWSFDYGRVLIEAMRQVPGLGGREAVRDYARRIMAACPADPLGRHCFERAAAEALAAASDL